MSFRRQQAAHALDQVAVFRRWVLNPSGKQALDTGDRVVRQTYGSAGPQFRSTAETMELITHDPTIYAVGPEMASEALRLSQPADDGSGLPPHPALSSADLGSRAGWVHFDQPLDLGAGYEADQWESDTARLEPHTRACRGVVWLVDEQETDDGRINRFLWFASYAAEDSWASVADAIGPWATVMAGPGIVFGVADRQWILDIEEEPRPGDLEVDADHLETWNSPAYGLYRWLIVFVAIARSTAGAWETTPPPRAALRRAQRVGLNADTISIIDLPRHQQHQTANTTSTEEQQLKYRSPVGGHMKSVAYGPGSSLRRVQWIAPYVRGADLPERPRIYRTD